MAEHGGPRTPRNPAPVSGPGKLSKRTDGGPGQDLAVPTGQPYGDRQALMAQERSAAMSQSPSIPTPGVPAQAQGGPPSAPNLTPLDDPTQRPDEPITHGVDIGPGAGTEALGFTPQQPQPDGYLTNMLRQMSATDTTGTLGKLYLIAQQRGV